MKLNKIDEVWNSANPLFKWMVGGECSHHCASPAPLFSFHNFAFTSFFFFILYFYQLATVKPNAKLKTLISEPVLIWSNVFQMALIPKNLPSRAINLSSEKRRKTQILLLKKIIFHECWLFSSRFIEITLRPFVFCLALALVSNS